MGIEQAFEPYAPNSGASTVAPFEVGCVVEPTTAGQRHRQGAGDPPTDTVRVAWINFRARCPSGIGRSRALDRIDEPFRLLGLRGRGLSLIGIGLEVCYVPFSAMAVA